MDRKITFFILFILATIFIIQASLALIIYLRPPKMIIRVNVTPDQPAIIERFLEVKNDNNVTVDVEFRPDGDIKDITTVENRITLEPNEIRNVDFTVEVKEPGTYNGKINVIYYAANSTGVALQAEILIFAEGPEVTTTIPDRVTGSFLQGLSWTLVSLIFVVIIVLILIVYAITRR